MHIAAKFLVSGTILAGGSGIAWKAYDTFSPKTSKDWFDWKGIQKVSKDLAYRGIFEENKESVNELGISDLTKDTTIKEAAKKIKEWCEKELDSFADDGKWPTILKFCKFNLTTTKGFLASLDERDFISSDDDYKISLFWLKSNNEWKSKVKSGEGEITHTELKNWCATELAKPISKKNKNLYSGLNFFCKSQEFDTVEKAIKKQSKDWTIATESDWETLFGEWKYTEGFIELLKKQNGNSDVSKDTEDKDGKDKLKNWCTSGKDKKLSEQLEDKFIDYIRSVCKKKS